MSLRTLLAIVVPFVLACGFGGSDDAADTGFGDDDFFLQVDVECDPDEITLTAESDRAESIEVEVWAGEDLVGTVDLVDRGAGDWFGSTSDTQLLTACSSGGYFLFRATDADGNTSEEPWSY
jgi:hypothetical protein